MLHNTQCLLYCLLCVVEIEMVSILPLGSIAVWDIYLTGSSLDTNSITFLVLQSPIVADV